MCDVEVRCAACVALFDGCRPCGAPASVQELWSVPGFHATHRRATVIAVIAGLSSKTLQGNSSS